MLQSSDDAPRLLAEGQSVLGAGWKEVDNFENLSDLDEYESDEEEEYVVMDLGAAVDSKLLQTDNSYQLIGLETPLPFLKLGNQIYQGEVSTLIGDEVIFGLIRNQEDPHNPSRPPLYTTSSRLVFRPVTLQSDSSNPAPVPTKGSSVTQPTRNSSIRSSRPVQSALDPFTSTSLSRDTSRTPASPAGDHSPGYQTILGNNSGSAAGPSEPKRGPGRPRSANFIGSRVPKLRVQINTLSELEELDITLLPEDTRVDLAPDVEEALGIQTSSEDGRPIIKRGYTLRRIDKLKTGKPLTGKGSRKPRHVGVIQSDRKGKKRDQTIFEDSGGLSERGEPEAAAESGLAGEEGEQKNEPLRRVEGDVDMTEDAHEERGSGEVEDEPLQEIGDERE